MIDKKIYIDVKNHCFDINVLGSEKDLYYETCYVITYWSAQDLKFVIDHIYPFDSPFSKGLGINVEHLLNVAKDHLDVMYTLLREGISEEDAIILHKKI